MEAQFDFQDLFNHLKDQVVILAELSLKKYIDEAKKDGFSFLEKTKVKLERWTLLLVNGDLNTEEYEWLVFSQKQLLEMKSLEEAGLAAIRIDQFKNSLINLVVDTVFSFIKI